MSGQTIHGDILDNRVSACGIVIEDGAMARIRPFIEASADLDGTFRIDIAKQSSSGSSMTSQANAFRAGSLGSMVIGVDRPSTVSINLDVKAKDGTPLCRLSRKLELGDGAIRL